MFDNSCGGCSCASCNGCGGESFVENYSCSSCDSCGGCGGNMGGFQKVKRTTTTDVKWGIAYDVGVDLPYLIFKKFDEMPPINNWKHCCLNVGIAKFEPTQLWFPDGSVVAYIFCQDCGTVHYYLEKSEGSMYY